MTIFQIEVIIIYGVILLINKTFQDTLFKQDNNNINKKLIIDLILHPLYAIDLITKRAISNIMQINIQILINNVL